MDIRTMFYLDCLKQQAGLIDKPSAESNLKNFTKVTQSKEYNRIMNKDGIFIGEGVLENTWVAHYDDDYFDEIELVFTHKPTKEEVQRIQFYCSIEEYLSDRRNKPYAIVDGVKTHWTLLPYNSPEKKWEQFAILRNEQEQTKQKKA